MFKPVSLICIIAAISFGHAQVGAESPKSPDGFSLIPAGPFAMGRSAGDRDKEAPPVTVTVGAFYMAKYEVTKAQWDEVRMWGLKNGYTDIAEGTGKAPDHPVELVIWFDVVKWCNAKSQKEGLKPVYTVGGAVMKTGRDEPTADWGVNGYRLPTEAEWEKAARGGLSGKRFPWGSDTISHDQANFLHDKMDSFATGSEGGHPKYREGERPYTSPVGSFGANGFGLHDMAGNVSEWCWDRYGGYGKPTYVDGATDPKGVESGTLRVFRGGSWGNSAFGSRVFHRSGIDATKRVVGVGFRLARSSVP
jgi:formylglycine-generating enzyme